MKCALLLSGLMRNWKLAYPSFKQYVIDRYDTEVFIDTWSEVGFYKGTAYQPTSGPFVNVDYSQKGFKEGELINVNEIIDVYHPKSIRVDDFSYYEPLISKKTLQFGHALTNAKNTTAMYWKRYRASQLIRIESFDIVVSARPDIFLEHDPGIFSPTEMLTLPSRNSRGKGTGDTIVIGGYSPMIDFCDLYLSLENLYARIGYSCPHEYTQSFIQDVCQKHRITSREMSIGAKVMHSKSGVPYEES